MARRPQDGLPLASGRGPADSPDDLRSDRRTALQLCPVSRETAARLDRFVELLVSWQRSINLISAGGASSLWTRHVADSLQLLTVVPTARRWVDLGSGGGFPGLVVACALADLPTAEIELVESNAKKAAFLREASRVLKLPARVHRRRIEDFVTRWDKPADVVSARGLAPITKLLTYSELLINQGATGLFPKGQDVDQELTEASTYWNIDMTLVPSVTDPRGRIVVVRRAEKRVRPSKPERGTDLQ